MLPPPPHNFILFQLDFDVKLPLLRPLLFLNDLKSTISLHLPKKGNKIYADFKDILETNKNQTRNWYGVFNTYGIT